MIENLNCNSEPSTVAIIISTYNRLNRFTVCLECLYSSILFSRIQVQVIIMDNSQNQLIRNYLCKFIKRRNRFINLFYAHCPFFNQSELRNLAFSNTKDSIKYLMLLDSDIYISKSTVKECISYLEENENIGALAPPLYSYFGGKHNKAREEVNKYIYSGSPFITMPDKTDYVKNIYKNCLLESKLLRGTYFIRKSILVNVFTSDPWLKTFKVWQNVPFFLTLKELNFSFGYLIKKSITALHDERPHLDTIKSSLFNWHSETIKSIILLFYRNKLWMETHQKRNSRFIETIKRVIAPHFEFPVIDIDLLYRASSCIELDEVNGKKELLKLFTVSNDKNFKDALKLLTNQNWKELQSIRSYNYNLEM